MALLVALAAATSACRSRASDSAVHVTGEPARPSSSSPAAPNAGGGPSPATGEPAGARIVELPEALEQSGRVTVEPAREGPVSDVIEAQCEVVPAPDGAADVAATVLARVVRWHVAPGAVVAAGAPVVTLDSREVAEQRAAIARARIDIDDYAGRVGEEDRLILQGATSERARREARAGLARARAAVLAAQRALAVARASESGPGGEFTLRAPMRGTVTRRAALVGQVVQPSTVLVSLVDLGALRVAAHVPEEAADVPQGARGLVTLRGESQGFPARIVWRDAALDPTTRTRLVHLVLEVPHELVLEQTGTARIAQATSAHATTVPAAAVHREGARATVFVRAAPGRYEARRVVLGRDDGAMVELVRGVTAGERVVVGGTFLVASELTRREREGQGGQ